MTKTSRHTCRKSTTIPGSKDKSKSRGGRRGGTGRGGTRRGGEYVRCEAGHPDQSRIPPAPLVSNKKHNNQRQVRSRQIQPRQQS
jgi:hypothetical protein